MSGLIDTTFDNFQVPLGAAPALVVAPTASDAQINACPAGVLSVTGDPTAGSVGRAVPRNREAWVEQLQNCGCLSEVGIALAWGLNAGFLPLKEGGARPPQPARSRDRTRGLFPLPVEIPAEISSLDCWSFLGQSNPAFSKLAVECWRCVSCAALNAYYGCSFSLTGVRAGKIHGAVRRNMVQRIKRFLKHDSQFGFSFEEVVKDLHEKRISYTGEEVTQPLPLTVNQIIDGLPPRGHGASVPIEPYVTGRTKYLLENPLESLLDVSERGTASCQAKVHVRPGESLEVFKLLEDRGIVSWVPSEVAFSDSRGTYLNGLFGVIKQGKTTSSGEPVLRVIMNLIPVNNILEVIKGDIGFLPSPTSWISIVADEEEEFTMSQGDMQSAFYLFRMPCGWEKFFCFNFCISGDKVGLDANKRYRPCCRVLPMGWNSSVGIMQQISRQVLLMRGLPKSLEIERVHGVPRWFTSTVAAADGHRAWWQVYLDNFMAGESSNTLAPSIGRYLQTEAMQAWTGAGILTAHDKQVLEETSVVELGIRFDGSEKLLGASPERLFKTLLATFFVMERPGRSKRETQVILGRWIFILQFRRAGMGCLSRAWESLERMQPTPAQRRTLVRELCMLACLGPLLQTDLTMEYDNEVTCSDASETGGAVAVTDTLSWSGRSYVDRGLRMDYGPIECPVLVISCFNGIGGAFRVYDVLGVKPLGLVSIDICKEGNRVTRSTWPQVEELMDINLVTKRDVQRWANCFARALEVHLWAGFPCVHLSSVRAFRKNLEGTGSNLFWKLLELISWVQEVFNTFAKVKFCIENVASMDEAARRQISAELEVMPVKLDPADCMPYSRPRLAWCSEELFQMEGLELWEERDYVRAYASGPAVDTQCWIRPGWSWPGESSGARSPTFMKAIKRDRPPPVPAGYSRASPDTLSRWRADSFRYPPYQYAEQFLLTHPSKEARLLDSSERELLLGFGPHHTATCMSASNMKRSLEQYEDVRRSLCGDSFSIFSFALMGAVLCSEFVPRMSPRVILQRLGLAPGASAHPQVLVPLTRWLAYGGDPSLPASSKMLVEQLGLTVNHTGSDVRVSSGAALGKKPACHCSVRAWWWQWKHLFKIKWGFSSHINLLEMRMILHAILWKTRKVSAVNKRWLHLEDSMVCLLILTKGRTSSRMLQPVVRQIGAIQLAMGAQLLHGHVGSSENPTDAASRA